MGSNKQGEHTPGPTWTKIVVTDAERRVGVYTADEFRAAFPGVLKDEHITSILTRQVAGIGMDAFRWARPYTPDDALRAAAPSLLAACKALCRRLESNELVNRPNTPGNEYDQPAYDAARAAIALAEGSGLADSNTSLHEAAESTRDPQPPPTSNGAPAGTQTPGDVGSSGVPAWHADVRVEYLSRSQGFDGPGGTRTVGRWRVIHLPSRSVLGGGGWYPVEGHIACCAEAGPGCWFDDEAHARSILASAPTPPPVRSEQAEEPGGLDDDGMPKAGKPEFFGKSNVRPVSVPEQKEFDETLDAFGIGEHPGQDTQVACRLALDLLTRERRILVASNTLGGVDDVSKVTDADVKEEIAEFDHAIEALNAVVCIKPPEGKGAPAAPSPVFQTWDGKTVHYGSVICPVTAPDSQWIAGAEDDEEFTGCIWLQHLHTDARMRLSREACGKCWELAVHRASATAPTKDPADLAQVIFNALDERTISREKVRGLVCQLLLLAR